MPSFLQNFPLNYNYFSSTLLCCLFFITSLTGQEIMVSEEVQLRSDQSYSIIGKYKEKTLLYRDKTTVFEVQAFNNERLSVSWTKELELDKKRPEVMDVYGLDDYFYVLYRYKNRGSSVVKIHKYNEAANLVDSTVVFDYGKRFYSPLPEVVYSEDKTKILLYHTEYFNKIEVAVFDIEKMELMWNKEYMPEDLKFGADFYQILADDEGGMHMILIRENERFKKDKPHYFEFIYQAAEGATAPVYKVPLEGKLTFDCFFKIDNLNRSVIGGGMHSAKNKGRTQGYYYMNIPISNPENYVLSFKDFELDFMEQLVDKKTNVTKGLFDVGIQDLVLRRDGGALIICEQLKDYERGIAGNNISNLNTTRSAFYGREAGRFAVDHYYEDLFLFSVHPDGQHHWENILHKKQFSQDDNAAFSSFFLAKTPQRLRLIYNDEIRSENTVSEYIIKGSGNTDRNSILNTASQELRLRFRESKQVAANEIIVPSERKSKLKLVRMTF
ncbi:MAG: hypothetical protein AAF960_03870 [Bacteroidota bacterium]